MTTPAMTDEQRLNRPMRGGRMRRHRTALLPAAVLAGVLALAGCSGNTDPEDDNPLDIPTATGPLTPEPTTATEKPTTTTEPSDEVTATTEAPTLSEAEQDEADAQAALTDYLTVLDSIGQGDADIQELNDVSVGVARDQWLTEMTAMRERGWTQEGEIQPEVLSLSINGDEAVAKVCLDVSQTDLVDESGESIVEGDRPERTLSEYVLERNEETKHGWIVSDDTNQGESCDE